MSERSDRLWLRVLSLARPESKTLIWGTLFLAIGSASTLALPQALRVIIDKALADKDLAQLNKIALIVLAVFSLQAIASSLRFYLFTLAGERIVLKLRERVYSHILDQDVSFFDFNRTGDLMSRLSSDSSILQNAVSVNISMGLRHLVSGLGGIALMIYTAPSLALSMLPIVPPIAVGVVLFGRRIRGASKRAQEALAEASIVAEETISGFRTVRSFAQEGFEKRRYGAALIESLKAVRQRITLMAFFVGMASLLASISFASVTWFGGRQVIQGELSGGDLTQFMVYLLMAAFSVGALGSLWGDFMSALGAAKRVFDILESTPRVRGDVGRELAAPRGQIDFSHVDFAYPSRTDFPILKDFSLTLEPGKVVALVGPSGAGKSTVSGLTSRFYDPVAGSIRFDGVEYGELKPDWLRHNIGMVSQEPVLISSTIADNIRYARPGASLEEVKAVARLANADEFISRFPLGYDTLVGEKGIQLSGGQKQRVAIARALLKDPKVLILDEATSALDTESEALVQDALVKLMKGRTTLVIAHRLATIQNADLICVMEGGRIVQRGTHAGLLGEESGIYRKLIEKQLRS